MTDVAHRSHAVASFGYRALEADAARDRSRHRMRRNRAVADEASNERRTSARTVDSPVPDQNDTLDEPFSLQIERQPPEHIRAGVVFETDVVVRLKLSETSAGHAENLSQLLAVATLIEVGANGPSTTTTTGVLEGRLVSTIASAAEVFEEDELPERVVSDGSGYFAFTGLAIKRPGRFRVRVTLIRMGAASGGLGPAGSHEHAVDTDVVDVDSGSPTPRRQGNDSPLVVRRAY